jgi:hypothetical protein
MGICIIKEEYLNMICHRNKQLLACLLQVILINHNISNNLCMNNTLLLPLLLPLLLGPQLHYVEDQLILPMFDMFSSKRLQTRDATSRIQREYLSSLVPRYAAQTGILG